MCDSFVALPHRAAAGAMLFAKNSDRERNEAQALEFKPAAEHDADASLLSAATSPFRKHGAPMRA
ncbi:MAG: hypothetical protein IPG56_15230 [Caulobacteraceae bacterium]|nr:hypothetical protein [Caulobacteraceae bacterium]